ncbi:MAG TPA: hypothetical protein PK653_00380 [Syntrophales bacterium]|nr:hypothetical protein [Syntrophales bacterium]
MIILIDPLYHNSGADERISRFPASIRVTLGKVKELYKRIERKMEMVYWMITALGGRGLRF